MHKHVIFFDLDGTLFTDNALTVTPIMKHMIHDLVKQGGLPVIATGRNYYEVKHLLDELDITSYILSNGCYVVHDNHLLQDLHFTHTEVSNFLDLAKEQGHSIGFFNQEGYAISTMTDTVKQHVAHMNMDIRDVPVDPDFYNNQRVTFLNLYAPKEEETIYHDALSSTYDWVRFTPLGVNILPKHVSKALGMTTLCDHLGLAHVPTYAFGNANNDIELFKAAQYSVAMADSPKELQEVATYVATSKDGVQEGLRYFDLLS